MANQLIRYEVGHGAGVALTADSGQAVIGNSTPVTTSKAMFGVAADNSGNLFMSDVDNSCIYKVTESGDIQLFSGTVGAEGNTDGAGSVARFNLPRGVAVDRSGTIYVADSGNGAIRRIGMDGSVGTVATGLTLPWGIACAPNGDIYVTDKGDHCVYRIRQGGEMTIVAGSQGNAGDIAAEYANEALFDTPTGIAVDPSGYVFVADSGNYKIKRIGLDGFVVRFCGTASSGDVLGTYQTSRFTNLGLMTVDRSGDLYVIDRTSSGPASGDAASESSQSSANSNSSQSSEELAVVDKIKKIDKNGNSALVSVVTGGSVVGIATTPSGVIYVTQSSPSGTNSSSSLSSSSNSSSSSSSRSSGG